MSPLVLGLVVGLASAAPLGPQNAYLMAVGLGDSLRRAAAATALVVVLDISVSLVTLNAAGALLERAPGARVPALLVGAAVLLVTGVRLLWPPRAVMLATAARSVGSAAPGPVRARVLVMGAVTVTWLNPAALLDGALVFGALVAGTGPAHVPAVLTGLCLASVTWAGGLLVVLRLVRQRLAQRSRRMLERAAGVVVLLVGLRIAGQALFAV